LPPPATLTIPAATEAKEAPRRPNSELLVAFLRRQSTPKFHRDTIFDLLANLGIHTTP
jgi:hypothetical protein